MQYSSDEWDIRLSHFVTILCTTWTILTLESAKLNKFKLYPLEVVSRFCYTQLQVVENDSYLFNLR